MDTKHFKHFAPVIKSLSVAELDGAPSLNSKLRLAENKNIEICYVPFEYINPQAKVVIVGITPGRTQMLNAIKEARRQLDNGAGLERALIAAKTTGAFSGAMRPNLIDLLDHVGINDWLGINSCDELFETSVHLVQTASVLKNAVFVDGENYNGAPDMIRNPLLREQLLTNFGAVTKILPNAIYVPLGDKVAKALHFIADQGCLNRNQIFDGLPHPSGANSERIAYFLGRKCRSALSVKTNADKLDKAREKMICQVKALAMAT
jgi:hypothetical protein